MPTSAGVAAASGWVVVESAGGRFRQHVQAGGHEWISDEPTSLGGDDAGPNPYDLLLAALGTCTSMTLHMYADRKGIDVGRIEVRLRHSRIHARDCESCESSDGYIDSIEREISFGADLDDATMRRLRHIADRCPVHRSLAGEIQITTLIS